MDHYLVVTAMGEDRHGIVNQVTHHISACGCNIVDSRLAILGSEFTFTMLLSGDWNAISQIEHTLPRRSHELALVTVMKRTHPAPPKHYPLWADAELLIRDEPGIISHCTQFFNDQGWDIHALQSETLPLKPADRLRASFQLRLPAASDAMDPEHAFALFCQRLGAERFNFSITRTL
ncbi:MAG: ACT domain-containing protein [Aeromonadaceae bacterium]